MKYLARFIRYIGVAGIIIFSIFSIFITLLIRDISHPKIQNLFSYAPIAEERFYDFRMQQTIQKNKNKSPHLTLAAIDDKSLNEIGRWPWSRTTWVRILDKLNTYQAKVVAFDVILSEPEAVCNEISPDILFKKAIRKFQSTPGNHVIIPYSTTIAPSEAFKEVPDSLYDYILDTKQSGNKNFHESMISSLTFPVKELLKANPMLGHIGAKEASDGVFRYYPISVTSDSLNFPSLGLLAYKAYTGQNPQLEIYQSGESFLNIKGEKLRINLAAEAKIRFYGDGNNFETVSLYDIYHAPDDPAKNPELFKSLQNKIVFIGSTAFGAHDLRHTPVDAKLPGVYFHMNLVHMLLHKYFYKPMESSIYISLAILLLGLLLLLVVQQLQNAIVDILVIVVISAAAFFIDTFYLIPKGYEIKLFFCLFSFIASYVWYTFINFYLMTKEKNKIRGTFSRYVAPAIVDEMLGDPEKLKVGGERREITCIFSDVRDFTSISEKLTPQQLTLCLNHYMGTMTDILFETYGTLDKYIGDALVGYWNAPLSVPEHAYHGIRGSIKMMEALPQINKDFKEWGYPEFKVGIGLNTGECSIGNMGSDKIFSYTALGDHMNLGSRLEGLCKFYGAQIIISEFTLNKVEEEKQKEFIVRSLDFVKVKGKDKPVKIYEVLYQGHIFYDSPKDVQVYNESYELYLKKEFKKSKTILQGLKENYPEDPSTSRMLEACEEYIQNPPPEDWDGVTVYKTK